MKILTPKDVAFIRKWGIAYGTLDRLSASHEALRAGRDAWQTVAERRLELLDDLRVFAVAAHAYPLVERIDVELEAADAE